MADRKISDLTALTTPASGDYLPIVDISEAAAASKNKRITIEELFRGVPLGSAAAPSIAIEGDEDTGVFSPGANQLAVATNGAGRLFVDANGNVGVGVTPTVQLHLSRSSGTSEVRVQSGATFGYMSLYSTGNYVGTGTAVPLIFNTNNAEKLRITAAGLVGIGVSAPSELLQVNGNIALDNAVINTPKYLKFIANSDGSGTPSYGGVTWYNYQWDYTKRAEITAGPDGAVAAGYLAFSTGNGGVSERVRITSAGLVGIGNSSPGGQLTVYSAGNQIRVESPTSSNADILFRENNVTKWTAGYVPFISGFRFSNGSSDILTLTNTGNVGIGTTSPGGVLEAGAVSGAVSSGDLLVTTGSTTAKVTIGRLSGTSNDNTSFRIRDRIDRDVLTVDPNDFIYSQGGSERCRVDASGRLLVGTSSARSNFFNSTVSPLIQQEGVSGSSRFMSVTYGTATEDDPIFILGKHRGASIGGNTIVVNNDGLGKISFQGSDGSELVEAAAIRAEVDGTPSANDLPGRLVFSTTADGASSPTERMRITSGGAMWLNTTTGTVGTTAFGTVFASDGVGSFRTSRNVDGVDHVAIVSGNVGIFVVRGDGDCENTNNSYGALSDVKLKENIVNASSQWNDISALQVRNYNFKTETGYRNHTQIGLIAQEVELVSPGLVSESPDRDEDGNDLGTVTKSVNYSVLYMKAVKALQEAMERIEVLEQRLNDAGIN